MRAFVDILQTLSAIVRFVLGMMVLSIKAVGLMLTVAGTCIAPKAVDSIAERVGRAGDNAIAAAQRERIAEDKGNNGWDDSTANASVGHPIDDTLPMPHGAPLTDDGRGA